MINIIKMRKVKMNGRLRRRRVPAIIHTSRTTVKVKLLTRPRSKGLSIIVNPSFGRVRREIK